LTRLPESSSICTELSASDITRPARNLPVSSKSTYMGEIVADTAAIQRPGAEAAALGAGVTADGDAARGLCGLADWAGWLSGPFWPQAPNKQTEAMTSPRKKSPSIQGLVGVATLFAD
jgi:hypothetical protein